MGEVKSVKVDNWGVFFLQKLQNFFNKTDYCDLTLQFRDNSQLKVHRLVLSACTDYFNVLEQTCEIVDDALIMPNEFQADVVVPIVNFMYTGTLEFELKMYGKLLRTAKEMNMTVLLKLLEAHRRTMENVNRAHRPPSPKGIRRSRGPIQISPQRSSSTVPQRNTAVQVQQLRSVSANTGGAQRSPNSSVLRTNAAAGQNSRGDFESPQQQVKQEQATSPFEQLRKGYNNNKRPATALVASPPAKKPNLEDVKEFAEQQRMRKQIAAEYGEDQEYEGMMDDDVHADDDDDEVPQPPPQASTSKQVDTTVQTTRVEHGGATIIFKQESPDQQPTIIVKDTSSTKLNHAKIIAEVLRQYPHLMKGQKNIKLKIMPNTPQAAPVTASTAATQVQKTIKKDTGEGSRPPSPQKRGQPTTRSVLTTSGAKPANSSPPQPIQQKGAPPAQKVIGSQTSQALPASAAAAAASAVQKRRIDSKTMHALIALGAENTTGPWLCLRCGVNNRPISIPSYRGFRRHLINTHKEAIDPALCEYCGWRSQDDRDLHYHMRMEHKVASSVYTFPECTLCNEIFSKYELLNAHLDEAHANSKQQCIYCNRFFAKELQLYTHMKTQHKEQAVEDGIIDDTDDEYIAEGGVQEEEDGHFKKDSKVKILSDISLPNANSLVSLESAETITRTEVEATNVEEILQTTSESEIKFVGPDGNEVQLTDEQRKEILSQLNQQEHGGVVMVLNETSGNEEQDLELEQEQQQLVKSETDNADVKSAAVTEESLGEEEINEEGDVDASSMAEDYDDSQIYNELNPQAAAGEEKKSASGQIDENKESVDNLEWAENLISEHERETSSTSSARSKKPNLSDKLKELTCDWTEDENDDDPMEISKVKTSPEKPVKELESEMEKPAEPQDANKTEETSEDTEVKKDATESNAVQEKDQEEVEDDIDLALQNLHKETSPEKEFERAQETESNTKTMDTTNKVDTDKNIESVVDELTDDTEVKAEPTDENEQPQEFMENSPVKPLIQNAEKTDATEKMPQPVSEGDDSQMERDKIKRELLDDLIAEADNAKNEAHDEISTKQGDREDSKVATTDVELETKMAEKPTEAIVAKTDATNDAATADVKVKDGGKVVEEATVAADKSESAPTNEELKPTTSGESSGPAEGTDKVKDIISDWGADDHDDDVGKVKK